MHNAAFVTLLQDELNHLRLLREVLLEEAQALLNQDALRIEDSVSKKSALLEQQNILTRNRENQVENVTGKKGLQALDNLASSNPESNLPALISELKSMADECRTINQNNGKLIHKRQRHTASALNVLRQTETGVAVYSDRGDPVESRGSRTLGKA